MVATKQAALQGNQALIAVVQILPSVANSNHRGTITELGVGKG